MKYKVTLKRIREGKTDYRKRKAILVGRHTFASIRISNENVFVQITEAEVKGDRVLVSAHSRELIKYGWKGSRKSIPACYLTGLLAGKKAIAKGIDSCIIYTGFRAFTRRIAACTKGLLDAGLEIPVDEDVLPEEDVIMGKHIVDYAEMLKDDSNAYNARFSALLARGLKPEDYIDNFKEVKDNILRSFSGDGR